MGPVEGAGSVGDEAADEDDGTDHGGQSEERVWSSHRDGSCPGGVGGPDLTCIIPPGYFRGVTGL
jgi:hypothetical protein